jgi:putative RNA 2'-phosphotransferase
VGGSALAEESVKSRAMTDLVSASKFLSLVLRHQPEVIGLSLDSEGWADIDEIIRLAHGHKPLTRALIEAVVANNNKQRFAISADGQRIRARQGHSVEVDLGFVPVAPPTLLYHGTATRFVDAIRRDGLVKRSRQHVHLSADAETATNVGSRHGKPVVLIIAAAEMTAAGHAFFLSENGVWLTDAVPAAFIDFGAP